MSAHCCLCIHKVSTSLLRRIPLSSRNLSTLRPLKSALAGSTLRNLSATRACGREKIFLLSSGGFSGLRSQSSFTNSTPLSTADVGFIPDAPPIPETTGIVDAVTELLQQYPEGSLKALGIGSYWTPAGWAQHALEFFQHTTDIPYWGVIAITTLILRLALFPVVIRMQRTTAVMSNFAPQTKEIQDKILAAQRRGDTMQAQFHTLEYQELLKKMGMNPATMLLNFLPQITVFLTFFSALRGMAKVNLPGFLDGGIWWFQNLTLPDPFYVLPIACASSLWLILEFGVDTGVAASSMRKLKWVMRAIPPITFCFMYSFPSAILVYWTSANLISLVQAGLLRVPAVRGRLRIPARLTHPPSTAPKKNILQTWKDMRKTGNASAQFRQRLKDDEDKWKNAAKMPIITTFKTNPKAKKIAANGGAGDVNTRKRGL